LNKGKRQHGRKRIDTWVLKLEGRTIKVHVYLIKEYKPYTESTHFRAEPEGFDDVSDWDENLDQLRRKITVTLRSKLTIKWTRMLHVRMLGRYGQLSKIEPCTTLFSHREDTGVKFVGDESDTYQLGEDVSADLQVTVEALLCGVDDSGNKFTRGGHGWGNRTRAGWPEENAIQGQFSDDRRNKGVAALVPDTPQNREALNFLFSEMNRLKEHLARLMTPAQLQETLSKTVGGLLALPPPPQEKKAKKGGRT